MSYARNAILTLTMIIGLAAHAATARLTGHVPSAQIAQATDLGRAVKTDMMRLVVPLKVNDQTALKSFVDHVSSPSDLLYGRFLSQSEFTSLFAPSQSDYDSVAQTLTQLGFQVTAKHPNRLLIEVQAPVATVEAALQTEIHQYQDKNGKLAHAPTLEPVVDAQLAAKIQGIVGLSSFTSRHKHIRHVKPQDTDPVGFTPPGIRQAYGLTNMTQTGAGQTVALVEFDGFLMSDITAFAAQYGLGTPNVQTVLIDGFNGVPSTGSDSGSDEVTLDIEMIMALAPQAKIVVYEASPTSSDADVLALLNKIATDNSASTISNSWGSPENQMVAATMQSENTIFMQFASQGQTSFVASGDDGAYDDGKTLSVDDPGSQPYSVDVGGTTLTVNGDGSYKSEIAWGSGSGPSAASTSGGSGGGISSVWQQPSFQNGLSTTTNMGSTSMRMVPDVALNADPNTGYECYFQGQLQDFGGGTSFASPLWAAFAALVNEQRSATGQSPLGYALPLIYQIGQGSNYTTVFHDITGGTNLYYPATAGYDLATGWGSFSGADLFTAMTSNSSAPNWLPSWW